ncbi:hypothetical protein PHAVU_007G255000 [Phaseolus vulgaris]
MDGGEDPSALAWVWVIEALSACKAISTPMLQGLIDSAPVGMDKFGEITKEIVSLRCLEELPSSVVERVASSTSDSRARFDISRGCQDVLQEILNETPLSNLKMTGAELLKSDVYPFINHKRAGNLKCHLEQLRQTILEGTHPHTDYLKERSGLFPRNNGYSVIVNDVKRDDHSAKEVGNSTNTENMVGNDISVSLTLENGNKTSKEHLLDNNSSPSTRSRVYSADDYLTEHFDRKQVCLNECDDFCRTSKRVKFSASTSFESKKEKPVSQLKQEVSEHLTERILLVSERGDHHVENNNKETLGGGSSEDIPNKCTVSKLCQPSSHIEVPRDESNTPFNDALMLQPTFGAENSKQLQVESIPHVSLADGILLEISGSKHRSKHEKDLQLKDPNDSQQQIAGVKAPDHTGNGCGVEKSGDIVYQGEKISLEMEKQAEQNLCLKCNESDQLPISDVNVIQSVVTECCLGMTTTLPTNDAKAEKNQQIINLQQPKQTEPDIAALNLSQEPVVCDKTIVGAVIGCEAEQSSDSDGYHNEKKCLEAKKHEFLRSHFTVDQDFSAMNELNKQNLCMKCNQGGQLLACKTTTCPLMVHEDCLGSSVQLDAEGNFFCPFCAYSRTISEYVEAKEKASLARKDLTIFISKGKMSQAADNLLYEFRTQEHCFSRKSSECEHIHVKNNKDDQLTRCEDNREDHVGEHANEANNLQFGRSEQQNSSCREKENVSNGSVEILREEKIGEMRNAKNITGVRVEENEVPTDHVDGHDVDTCTGEKTNNALVNKSNAGYETPQEMTKQQAIDGATEPVCAHNTGKEEMSEIECDKHSTSSSRYSMRYRKHEMQWREYRSLVSMTQGSGKTFWLLVLMCLRKLVSVVHHKT